MIRDKHNIIPMFMAGLLHVGFIASSMIAFDFGSTSVAATPLILEAQLVSAEEQQEAPPPVRQPEPEPEPEIEPEFEEEPPPPVDQERIEAEERMRQEELARENARIEAEAEAERKRVAEEAAERKRREEAELERKRVEAERKRQEEVERQRLENERLRKEAMVAEAEALRQDEIAREEERIAAMSSGAMSRYVAAIQGKIQRNFIRPASARSGIECVINVRQAPGGDVISVHIGRCNGNDAVRRAIEAAVHKASPLPLPEDQILFARDLIITFKPEE